MRTSTRGTRNSAGFTLVELAVVLFVLGLILWTVAPRLSRVGDPGREAVFRDLAAGSEQAFDISLFEKKETRLILSPAAGTYEFQRQDPPGETSRPREASPKEFGSHLSVTGILVEGEERPLDIATEIRFLPGGRVPAAWIFIEDKGDEGKPTRWTLRINPWDGSMKVLEGTVKDNG